MSIFFSLILLMFLYFLNRKKVSFEKRVFAALFLGIIFGIYFKENIEIVSSIGQVFVKLIKMLVIPLVTASIISSISSLDDSTQLKKIGLKTISLFLLTAVISSTIGIFVGNALEVGAGVQFVEDSTFKAKDIPTITQVVLDLVPSNPLADMAAGKILPVIIFSMFIGIAITIEGERKPEAIKPLKDFVNSFAQAMFRITKIVLNLTPYGVFGLMSTVSAKYGITTLLPLGKLIIAVYLASIIHVILTYGSMVAFIAKVNPVRFFKKIYPAQIIAFTTRSSYGTLPVTLNTLTNRVKISNKIASFVAPLGATINMDGCGGLYPAIVAIFVANVFNIELSLSHYLILVITATLASIGTAGVPGTASIMATVVLTGLGLPIEGVAIILGIDPILDMIRTMVNVSGDTVVALLVADSEKEFDREAFNRNGLEEMVLTN